MSNNHGQVRNNSKAEVKIKNKETGWDQITVKDLLKLPYYVAQGVKYHTAGRIYTPKPIWTTLNVTHRCNSRCVMCSEWTRQNNETELTLAEIGGIYRNPLFSSIKRFALSGGEPTLREDLVAIVQTVLDACLKIQHVIINTNGLDPDVVIDKVNELLILAENKSLSAFTVIVSIDGLGDTHQKIRRVPEAFERATETLNRLKMLQRKKSFELRSTCVVQPLNIGNIRELANFYQEVGLPITFAPVNDECILLQDNAPRDSVKLSDDHLAELQNLLEHKLQPYLTPSHVIYWREYFNIVRGKRRKLPCLLQHHHAGVDCNGALYMCFRDMSLVYGNMQNELPDRIWYSNRAREMRKRAEKYFCPKCTIFCDTAFSLRSEFFYYAMFLFKQMGR